MKKSKSACFKALLVAMLICCLFPNAGIGTPTRHHAAGRGAAAKHENPLDLLGQALAANHGVDLAHPSIACDHHRFAFLADALGANSDFLTKPKSEFETDDQFKARLEKLKSALGNYGSLFACWDLDDTDGIDLNYDAEKASFHASVHDGNVWRDSKKVGTYNGRTRMGVRFTFTGEIKHEYDLSFTNKIVATEGDCVKIDSSSYRGGYSFDFAYPLSVAPILKDSGKLVVEYKLDWPYVVADQHHKTASLDDPVESITNSTTVYGEVLGFKVVSPSGNVVWSCKVTESKSSV